MIKKQTSGSIVSVDITKRTSRSKFLHHTGALIDWAIFGGRTPQSMQTVHTGRSRETCLPSLGPIQNDAPPDLVQSL